MLIVSHVSNVTPFIRPTSAKDTQSSSFVCLFVCLLATLHKNVRTYLHEIFSEGWQWANEQMIHFFVAIRIRIRLAKLVRRPWRRYAVPQCF